MKILVSADWHLKLGQKSVPKDWAINRYKALFSQIHALENKVELHVIAGDIMDRLLNMEELALYFDFIVGCTVETLIIPGNHESDRRNTTFLTHLKDVTSGLNPLVRIVDDYFSNDVYDVIPYNKLKEFKPENFHNRILFTHCRGDIPPHVKAEIDLSLFDRWDRVYLGDLHSRENSQRNLYYPGSPITTSFHRSKVDTGVIILDTDTLDHEFITLELPQLIRKTIKAGEPTTRTDFDHTIYEIEGDMAELSGLDDHELIDKKVSKKANDSALILDPEMTLVEEVREYLMYILNLQEDTINKVLQELQDSAGKIE